MGEILTAFNDYSNILKLRNFSVSVLGIAKPQLNGSLQPNLSFIQRPYTHIQRPFKTVAIYDFINIMGLKNNSRKLIFSLKSVKVSILEEGRRKRK